jgi:hypothetical protein
MVKGSKEKEKKRKKQQQVINYKALCWLYCIIATLRAKPSIASLST